MTAIPLRSEERLGLGIAVVAHCALIAALIVVAAHKPEVAPLPERMVVSLADDVSLKSAAPVPAQEAQASVAETLADKPIPKPEVNQPKPAPTPPPMQRTASREKPKPQPQQAQKSGGSRIGDDFLPGTGSSEASNAPVPASQIGQDVQASLQQAIDRQLRRYWQPPSGADADLLRTYLAFNLNPDGSLAGAPRLIRQSGVNDSNRAQAGRHLELAMRAVRLAAPFDLPPKYYNAWKRIDNWEFKWTPPQ